MVAKIKFRENQVISLKLTDNLFTLAQMRVNSLVQFFNIKSNDGVWLDVNLNNVEPIFCIYLAENKMKSIINTVESSVIPSTLPIPRLMLKATPAINSRYKAYVDLIELDDTFSVVNAKVIKKDLTPDKDYQDLVKYELTSMLGNPDKLRLRLERFFDKGINWDDQKSFIFNGELA